MKKILAMVLLAALCLSLVACGSESGVTGKWECDYGSGYVMTLESGGKGTMLYGDESYDITYEFESKSNAIVVTLNGNSESGNYMEDSDTLYIDGLTFTRVK